MRNDQFTWPPFCGEEFVAHDSHGRARVDVVPIVCTRDFKHLDEKHRNDELGFEWW